MNDALLEKERDQLANALERLADVQRELAEGQRSLMTGPSPPPPTYNTAFNFTVHSDPACAHCFQLLLQSLSNTILTVHGALDAALLTGPPEGHVAACFPAIAVMSPSQQL